MIDALEEKVARAISLSKQRAGDTDAIAQQYVETFWRDYLPEARIAVATLLPALAKPASEPAGGDVAERHALKTLMKAIQRAEDGAGTLPAKEAVKLRPADWHAVCDQARKLAALSSSAGPAVEAVVIDYLRGKVDHAKATGAHRIDLSLYTRRVEAILAALYAHPAPATVEMDFNKLARRMQRLGAPGTEEELEAALRAALAPATEGRKG